jgi:hypothetical protein
MPLGRKPPELLRHEPLSRHATAGVDYVRERMGAALRRGQEAGTVPGHLDPERATRVAMALLHGFFLQRVAFPPRSASRRHHDRHLTSTSIEVVERSGADDRRDPVRRP